MFLLFHWTKILFLFEQRTKLRERFTSPKYIGPSTQNDICVEKSILYIEIIDLESNNLKELKKCRIYQGCMSFFNLFKSNPFGPLNISVAPLRSQKHIYSFSSKNHFPGRGTR